MRRARDETGATAAEYVGVFLIVGVIVALVAQSGVGAALVSGTRAAMCRAFSTGDCAPADFAPVAGQPQEAPEEAAAPPEEPADAEPDAPWWDPDRIRREFGEGVVDGVVDVGRGLRDTAVWVGNVVTGDEETLSETGDVLARIARDPRGAVREVAEGVWEPIQNEIDAGRPAAAAGRGVVVIAEVVFGGRGLGNLRRLGRLDAPDAPDAPNRPNGPDVDFVDLTTPEVRRHILDGEVRPDGTFSGGHRPGTGHPGKTEFPADWSDDRIIHAVSDIATDPNARVIEPGNPSNPRSTRVVEGVRDGVVIRVFIRDGQIRTGFPRSGPGVVTNPP